MKKSLICLALLTALAGCDCNDSAIGPDGSTGIDGSTGSDIIGGSDGGWDIQGDGPLVLRDGQVVITEDGGATYICQPVTCDGHDTECGDCEDNDGDGLVDARDPECLGPCDNTEGPGLLAGVGGESGGPCKADCYFDFGNGSGNDECSWDSRCDPQLREQGCEYEADLVGGRDCPMPQNEMCHNVCRPLTPNGCDCFGCCTFDGIAGRSAADGGEYVWIGSTFDDSNDSSCTLADIGDTSLCHSCTPVADCFNDCGRCELCVGRDELPADCVRRPDAAGVDGGVYEGRCDPGIEECGLAGEAACREGYYCTTGCCIPVLI